MSFETDWIKAEETKALDKFRARHPEVHRAAESLLLGYIAPLRVTEQALEAALRLYGESPLDLKTPAQLDEDERKRQLKEKQDAEARRQWLIQTILDNRQRSPQERQNRAAQLGYMDLARLESLWAEIQMKQNLKGATAEEVAERIPKPALPAQFLPLPPEVTKAAIMHASREELRKLFKFHGSEALQARLEGRG